MKNLQDILKNWWDNTGSGIIPELNKAGTFEDYEEFVYRILQEYNDYLNSQQDVDSLVDYLKQAEGEMGFEKSEYNDGCLAIHVDFKFNDKVWPRIWWFDEKDTQKIVDSLKEKL